MVPTKPGNQSHWDPVEGRGEPEHGTAGGHDDGNSESPGHLHETAADSRAGEAGNFLDRRVRDGVLRAATATRDPPYVVNPWTKSRMPESGTSGSVGAPGAARGNPTASRLQSES